MILEEINILQVLVTSIFHYITVFSKPVWPQWSYFTILFFVPSSGNQTGIEKDFLSEISRIYVSSTTQPTLTLNRKFWWNNELCHTFQM